MKYCINCGSPLPDEAKFCSKCGFRQPEKEQPMVEEPVVEEVPVVEEPVEEPEPIIEEKIEEVVQEIQSEPEPVVEEPVEEIQPKSEPVVEEQPAVVSVEEPKEEPAPQTEPEPQPEPEVVPVVTQPRAEETPKKEKPVKERQKTDFSQLFKRKNYGLWSILSVAYWFVVVIFNFIGIGAIFLSVTLLLLSLIGSGTSTGGFVNAVKAKKIDDEFYISLSCMILDVMVFISSIIFLAS